MSSVGLGGLLRHRQMAFGIILQQTLQFLTRASTMNKTPTKISVNEERSEGHVTAYGSNNSIVSEG